MTAYIDWLAASLGLQGFRCQAVFPFAPFGHSAYTGYGLDSNVAPQPEVSEPVSDTEAAPDEGERFDPFCHTLDEQGCALCFADIRGRRAHNRSLPNTSSAFTAPVCQTCGKVVCPTCLEVEYRLWEAS